MPTLNWIIDSAVDHQADVAAAAAEPLAPSVLQRICPFCDVLLEGEDATKLAGDLARHVAREHPLRRPLLVIGDRVISARATLTRLPVADDIVLANVTEAAISVDGAGRTSIDPREIRSVLGESPRRHVRLELRNTRPEDSASAWVEYEIRIAEPDEEELAAIDEAFLEHLTGDASLEAVTSFSADTDGYAAEYRDGLAGYVLAVVHKDDLSSGSDPASRLERAAGLMNRTVTFLEPFADRPVASAVRGCARLNLNDLAPGAIATRIPAVDRFAAFLFALARSDNPPDWPARPTSMDGALQCPIDRATYQLLELAFDLERDNKPEALATAQADFAGASLFPADRTKYAAVVGEWGSRNGDPNGVEQCSKLLIHDPIFWRLPPRWEESMRSSQRERGSRKARSLVDLYTQKGASAAELLAGLAQNDAWTTGADDQNRALALIPQRDRDLGRTRTLAQHVATSHEGRFAPSFEPFFVLATEAELGGIAGWPATASDDGPAVFEGLLAAAGEELGEKEPRRRLFNSVMIAQSVLMARHGLDVETAVPALTAALGPPSRYSAERRNPRLTRLRALGDPRLTVESLRTWLDVLSPWISRAITAEGQSEKVAAERDRLSLEVGSRDARIAALDSQLRQATERVAALERELQSAADRARGGALARRHEGSQLRGSVAGFLDDELRPLLDSIREGLELEDPRVLYALEKLEDMELAIRNQVTWLRSSD